MRGEVVRRIINGLYCVQRASCFYSANLAASSKAKGAL